MWSGSAAQQLGRLGEAEQRFERKLGMYRALHKADPANSNLPPKIGNALWSLGTLAQARPKRRGTRPVSRALTWNVPWRGSNRPGSTERHSGEGRRSSWRSCRAQGQADPGTLALSDFRQTPLVPPPTTRPASHNRRSRRQRPIHNRDEQGKLPSVLQFPFVLRSAPSQSTCCSVNTRVVVLGGDI